MTDELRSPTTTCPPLPYDFPPAVPSFELRSDDVAEAR